MVNTVSYPTGQRRNADGLVEKYGLAEAAKSVAGSPTSYGGNDVTTLLWEIDYANLPAFSANDAIGQIYGGYPNQAIPSGAFITRARITPTTAFAGATATLTFGLCDDAGAELVSGSKSGIFAAIPVASLDTIGESLAAGNLTTNTANTYGGAYVGNNSTAVTTAIGHLWVSVQTATFTAGHAVLEIEYRMPRTNT